MSVSSRPALLARHSSALGPLGRIWSRARLRTFAGALRNFDVRPFGIAPLCRDAKHKRTGTGPHNGCPHEPSALGGLPTMNFARVVRMAIRYKFTFAASIISALVVAVLWGGNISTVYPVVEVVFKNQSMQQWVDGKIAESQATIAAKSADLDTIAGPVGRRRAAAATQTASAEAPEWRFANAEVRVFETSRDWRAVGQRARQALHRRATCPPTPFRTLVLITGGSAGGNGRQGRVPGGQQRVGRAAVATGHLRFAEAVLPPHVADGPGHVRRRRHGRPDEPLHQRHEPGGRRAWIRCSASWSASR